MAKLRLWERRQTELAQIGSLELKTLSGAQKTLHKHSRAKKKGFLLFGLCLRFSDIVLKEIEPNILMSSTISEPMINFFM